jgi:hypothetical protein
MYMQDTEANKLNQLLAYNPQLQLLFEQDIVVKSWFNLVIHGSCTLEKALVGIATTAIKEKHFYYQEFAKLKANKLKNIKGN